MVYYGQLNLKNKVAPRTISCKQNVFGETTNIVENTAGMSITTGYGQQRSNALRQASRED
ncbi:unnamed protein product [Clavelina lepadiformis]|uniref:Uncharacterized protein n=1 Tax=Clavelina lepadiformis TaxID=159417 RepID=A0ABP0FKY3_CLALP